MKKGEVAALVMAGGKFLIGEYRSTKVDHINWRDGQTGRALSADIVKHTVEFGNDTIIIQERQPEGFNPVEYRPPYKKGQPVAWFIETLENSKGALSGRGRIEALE